MSLLGSGSELVSANTQYFQWFKALVASPVEQIQTTTNKYATNTANIYKYAIFHTTHISTYKRYLANKKSNR